jgi:hypothetical protein
MLPDFSPVEDALREWLAAAGVHADQLVLNRRGRPVLLLPLTGQAPEGGGRNVPLEVLKLLREAGKPLTCLAVLEELERRGVPIGKSTLDRLLAKMVSDGDLANPQARSRRGTACRSRTCHQTTPRWSRWSASGPARTASTPTAWP